MKSARIALVWSFAERYLSLILTLATSMVLARLLTPLEIGVFSLCAATMAIASTVRDFGVSEYILQEKNLTEDKIRSAFSVAIVTAWSIGLVIFLSRHAMARYYAEPRIESVIAVLALNFVVLPFASPAYALINRDMDFRKIFMVQLLSTLCSSGTAVALALAGHGPQSLAWAAVAGMLGQALMVTLMRPKSSLLWPGTRHCVHIFRFGLYQMGSRVLESLTSNAHEFIIARHFGFAQVGLFSRAKSLVDMFHSNVTGAIVRVVTPDMAATVRAEKSLVQTFSRGTALFTCLSWPFFGFLALTAPEIIGLMFGPQWAAAGPLASALAVAMLPSALFALSGGVLAAMGQVERRLKISFTWCPFHLLGLVIAAAWGFDTLPWVWALTNIFIAFLYAVQLRSLLGSSLRELFGASLASLPVALVCVAGQYLVLRICRHVGMNEFVLLLLSALTSAALWYLSIRLLRHPVHGEVVRVLRWFHDRNPMRAQTP